ncbi:MAG: NosD domain-containing protein, partial [Actinomycetota bacterium]
SGNNTFYWNNFTSTSGLYVNDTNGSNYYNTTLSGHGEGNIWANIINGSVNIVGTSASLYGQGLYYGTSGSGYPYNNSTSGGKVIGNVVDAAPLINATALQCSNLATAGATSTMTTNLSISGSTCFNVTAANVTLDCSGYSITGNNSTGTYGIYSNQSNTTVKNCIISNFERGIFFNATAGGTIQNNALSGNKLYLLSSTGATISGNNASGVANSAIYFESSSSNTIANNTANATTQSAFVLSSSSSSNLTGNTFISPTDALYMQASSSNNFTGNTATASTQRAIALFAASGSNSFTLNNATAGADAIYLAAGSSSNSFTSNIANASGSNAVHLHFGANDNNRFVGNTLTAGSGGTAIYGESGGSNTFLQNNISSGVWVNSNDATNVFNNSTEGNIYYFANNTPAWQAFDIKDTNHDGWADTGSSLPLNATTVPPYWAGLGQDYFPSAKPNYAPAIAYNLSFSDASAGHWFIASAGVSDQDGAGDIASTNISVAGGGSCAYLSNSTALNSFNATYNCTGTAPAAPNATMGFIDSAGYHVQSGTAQHAYPDHLPSLTSPSVSSPINASSTATCTNGTFADIDSDSENATARAWNWYKNGALVAGTSSTLLLSSVGAAKGDNIACRENATATTWTASIATNISSNVTVSNSAPYSPSVGNFTDASAGHSFTVNGTVTDDDGGTDIGTTNASTTAGSCAYVSNSTSGTTFNVMYNCTGTSPGSATVTIGFTDASSAYTQASGASHTFPDHLPSLTSPSVSSPINA